MNYVGRRKIVSFLRLAGFLRLIDSLSRYLLVVIVPIFPLFRQKVFLEKAKKTKLEKLSKLFSIKRTLLSIKLLEIKIASNFVYFCKSHYLVEILFGY